MKNELGIFIKNKRKSLGLNQDQLGEILNLSRVSISNLENGKNIVGINIIQKLSKWLDVSPQVLTQLQRDKRFNINGEIVVLADDLIEIATIMQENQISIEQLKMVVQTILNLKKELKND